MALKIHRCVFLFDIPPLCSGHGADFLTLTVALRQSGPRLIQGRQVEA